MSYGIIDIIKKVSLDVIKEEALQILYGKVETVQPITIRLSNSLVLTQEFIVLDSPVDKDEDVIVIKYSNGNKYLVLSTIEKVYKTQPNTGGVDVAPVVTDGTWTTCRASAYGDSDIGNLTANGERLTANSMTVAVPMGAYYRKHRNKRMLVNYNGKTVTVRVTDCGNFGEGNKYTNRQLDLAPGVWKAFGFKSTSDWGLSTVQYKYID